MITRTVPTHIGDIRPGDTVTHSGRMQTVCAADLRIGFCGRTLFGDSYKLGTVPVLRVVFDTPTPPHPAK